MLNKKDRTVAGWRKYYGTWRPTTAPHEQPDLSSIANGAIWKNGGLLARWVTDFDCGCTRNFWYCIKDTPFDINDVKAKKRYYIKKGMQHFDVVEIECAKYLDELYIVTEKALETYSGYKGPQDKKKFIDEICQRNDLICLGAFERDSGKLCGYLRLKEYGNYVDFMNMKVDPGCEKLQINYALVYELCRRYEERLRGGDFYICDGMRAINHETHFQDWLEYNFLFRKAYCRLHIAYPWGVRLIVNCLFPGRNTIYKFGRKNPLVKKIYTILQYEEIAREGA